MKVKMRTLAAGPQGVLQAEQVYDLPAEMAQGLVAGGYADPVRATQVETAAMHPPEAAVQPAARPKRGKAR